MATNAQKIYTERMYCEVCGLSRHGVYLYAAETRHQMKSALANSASLTADQIASVRTELIAQDDPMCCQVADSDLN